MKQLIKPAHDDPHNSVDLFDADEQNDFDCLYCVAPGILRSEVDFYWQRYCEEETGHTPNKRGECTDCSKKL